LKRTPHNIFYHELIGLEVIVEAYPDPNIRGLRGVIVWETRRSLDINTGVRVARILKDLSLLRVNLPGYGWIRIKGELLTGTPPDRAKRILRGR